MSSCLGLSSVVWISFWGFWGFWGFIRWNCSPWCLLLLSSLPLVLQTDDEELLLFWASCSSWNTAPDDAASDVDDLWLLSCSLRVLLLMMFYSNAHCSACCWSEQSAHYPEMLNGDSCDWQGCTGWLACWYGCRFLLIVLVSGLTIVRVLLLTLCSAHSLTFLLSSGSNLFCSLASSALLL